MKKILICLIFLSSLGLEAGGKLREAKGLINTFFYVRGKGVVAAALTKDGCSCLFASGMAKNFPKGEKSRKGYFLGAIEECQKRASIPLLKLIKSNVSLKVVETDRKVPGLPFSEYKIIAESWDRSVSTFNRTAAPQGSRTPRTFKVLKQRFEGVLDKDPRFGCRMRKTYDYERADIKKVYQTEGGLDVKYKDGSGEFLYFRGNNYLQEVVLKQAEIPVTGDWPISLR